VSHAQTHYMSGNRLGQFTQEFRPCFSKPQFKYFVTVLLGLVRMAGAAHSFGAIALYRPRLFPWAYLASLVKGVGRPNPSLTFG